MRAKAWALAGLPFLLSCSKCGVNEGPGAVAPRASVSAQVRLPPEDCHAETCASLALTCGRQGDGCGGVLDCGSCDPPLRCTSGMCLGRSGANGRQFPTAQTTGITKEHCPRWESTKKNTEGRVIKTDGAVIEYEQVHGRLQIEAKDVTLRCVKIVSNSHFSLQCGEGCEAGLLVENVEADNSPSGSANSGTLALLARTATVIRSHFHGACDTAKVDSGLVRDSLFNNDFVCGSDGHNDGWQSLGSSGPIWFLHNTIMGREKDQTAAVILQGVSGPVRDVTLVGNLFFGGNYSLYLRGPKIPDQVRVHKNQWVKGSYKYGPTSIESNGPAQCIEWRDNVFTDQSEVDGPTNPAIQCAGISPVPTWRVSNATLNRGACRVGACGRISIQASAGGSARGGAPRWRYQCKSGELWAPYPACDGKADCNLNAVCDYSGARAGKHEIRVYSESGPGAATRDSDILVLPISVNEH